MAIYAFCKRMAEARFFLPLAVVVVTFLAYLPAMHQVHFLWDGWAWQACAAEWPGDPAKLWTLDPSYSFRPLTRVIYLGMFLSWGEQPLGYLVTILALHVAAALAAGALVGKVTAERSLGPGPPCSSPPSRPPPRPSSGLPFLPCLSAPCSPGNHGSCSPL